MAFATRHSILVERRCAQVPMNRFEIAKALLFQTERVCPAVLRRRHLNPLKLARFAPRFSGTIGLAPLCSNDEDGARVYRNCNYLKELIVTALPEPAALSREIAAKIGY